MKADVSNPEIYKGIAVGCAYPVLLEITEGSTTFKIELTSEQARALAWELNDKALINDEEYEARQARRRVSYAAGIDA